ncbi:hypothetical protein AB4Z18_17625 [Leifsonia sp. 2TAF2]|uniref:hypothetical protein n=1 Tax=Leifsonia sp. 2TAF2 TaxID=3233009 RepID=UPI003F96173A
MGTETPDLGLVIADEGPLIGTALTAGDADRGPVAPPEARLRRSLSENGESVRPRSDDSAQPILGRSGAPARPETLVASSSGTVT